MNSPYYDYQGGPGGYTHQQNVAGHNLYEETPQYVDYSAYNYDTSNIQYRMMSVDEWGSIPVDPSPYSRYWQNDAAFEPEHFSSNRKESTKYFDAGWSVAFVINLLITIGLTVAAFVKNNPFSNSSDTNLDEKTSGILIDSIWVGVLIAVGLNILHFIYMSKAPGFYIKFGVFTMMVIVVAMSFLPLFYGVWYSLIVGGLYSCIMMCVYCCMQRYIPISIEILAKTCDIMWKYPSIFFVVFLQIIADIIVSVIFTFLAYQIHALNWSPVVYVYAVFSFVWINMCIFYVLYCTVVGAAGTEYFLEGTSMMPDSPVWESFKRATTTSFGSCVYASFIVAVVRALRFLAENTDSDNAFLSCLSCIVLCILQCIESLFRFIAQYGLIYCALFGVPFTEGCRRFFELDYKKFIRTLMGGCIVDYATGAHLFGMMIISVGLGLLFSWIMHGEDETALVLYPIAAFILSTAFFYIIESPVDSIVDTLFICYAEQPKRLKQISPELDEAFRQTYSELLGERVERSRQ